MLPNAGIFAAGNELSPYQKYQAHIRARATAGFIDFAGTANANARYTTARTISSGGMIGSPWNAHVEGGASINRLVQHAMPDQAAFDAVCAAGTDVLIVTSYIGNRDDFEALNRNGFTSLSSAAIPGSFVAQIMTEITWWDSAASAAKTLNPSAGSSASSYTVP